MKKFLIATLALALLGTAAWADVEYAPGTGIVGSPHDMNMITDYTFAKDSQERVCAYCHTPHHADVDSHDYMPLWSRTVTGETTFSAYSSETLDAESVELGRDSFMFGPSILCMSCHDGVVAPDAYYGDPGTAGFSSTDDYGDIGVGLDGIMRNDHPIGFDYTQVQRIEGASGEYASGDPEIRNSADPLVGNYKIQTISEVLWGADGGLGVDGAEYFTCASCHDVHNGPTVVDNYLLYGPQKDSEFCTMCHIK